MTGAHKAIGSAAAVAGSAAALATVRDGVFDVADAGLLMLSLTALARIVIRQASDVGMRRRRE